MRGYPPPVPQASHAPAATAPMRGPAHGTEGLLPGELAGGKRHREMLWIALGVIALSFVLRVQGDRVAVWCLPQWPVPHTCGARAWLGVTCPGCGLTRSFVYLAQGRWEAASRCHRLGWLLALATVLQVPYRLACLKGVRVFTAAQARWVSGALIFALVANWVLEQIARVLR